MTTTEQPERPPELDEPSGPPVRIPVLPRELAPEAYRYRLRERPEPGERPMQP